MNRSCATRIMREHETLRMRHKASGGPSARSSRGSRGSNKQEEGGARRRASGGARRRVGVVTRLGSANHATGGKGRSYGGGEAIFSARASVIDGRLWRFRSPRRSTEQTAGRPSNAPQPQHRCAGPRADRCRTFAFVPDAFAFFAFRRCLTLKHLESHLNIFQHVMQLLKMVKR